MEELDKYDKLDLGISSTFIFVCFRLWNEKCELLNRIQRPHQNWRQTYYRLWGLLRLCREYLIWVFDTKIRRNPSEAFSIGCGVFFSFLLLILLYMIIAHPDFTLHPFGGDQVLNDRQPMFLPSNRPTEFKQARTKAWIGKIVDYLESLDITTVSFRGKLIIWILKRSKCNGNNYNMIIDF